MAAQGTTTIDFGAFPGKTDVTLAVASAGIGAGALVEAWIYPVATASHSADEHMVEDFEVHAHSVSAGVGFSITAHARGRQRIYGQWTIGWVYAP